MAFEDFKILNYNNSQVSPELFARHQSRLFTGNVIDGLTLVPKTGLTVTLQPGNGMVGYGTGATASARLLSLVADFDITLSTADASNPRIDSIVCYVDSITLGAPTVDGQGVWKAVKVNGTPNASPVAPDNTAIQAIIGSGKPYFVAHDVRVDAAVTTIAANKITDRRVMVGPSASFVANIPNATVTKEKIDLTSFRNGTDANGWTLTFNAWGKRVYTRKVSRAISLTAGISFVNYHISSTPVAVGSDLASYFCAFAILMPAGSRHISTSIMYGGTSIELGAINNYTGGSYSGTANITLTITET